MLGEHDSAAPGGDARPDSPVDERGRIAIERAEGWYLLPFERDDATEDHRITLEREDGVRAQLTLPGFVEQGDELLEIARLVIRARERWGEIKGLGG